MISIRDLHHSYGGPQPALGRLNLEIPEASVFALIGPNGAGKTTLLRILATLIEPTYGTVRIGGIDVLSRPHEARRLIGYMADDFALYEEMRVADYLTFFAACHAVPAGDREDRCARLLERVRLGEKCGDKIRTLSRGMRQRLCLAKTLVHDPRLLLLDEPASGLDPQARIEFRDLIRSLGREGRTVVISSHILSELSDFCDALAILERGRAVVAGRIDEVLRQVESARRCRLRTLGDAEAARGLLASCPGVQAPVLADGQILFSLEGGDPELADLHACLVTAGVRVLELALERRNLESIFMQVSSHDVA